MLKVNLQHIFELMSKRPPKRPLVGLNKVQIARGNQKVMDVPDECFITLKGSYTITVNSYSTTIYLSRKGVEYFKPLLKQGLDKLNRKSTFLHSVPFDKVLQDFEKFFKKVDNKRKKDLEKFQKHIKKLEQTGERL